MHIEFCVNTHPSWHSPRLTCMVIASVANCRCVACLSCDLDKIVLFKLKRETEDQLNLKYGEYRRIGSGATVQSVTRCLLVVTMAVPFFHDGSI